MDRHTWLSFIVSTAIIVGFVLYVLIFASCATAEEIRKNDAMKEVTALLYLKDHRTNLCFAVVPGPHGVLTNVPCTKEVENLLIN